jgi:quercetin dioxygenase-like cupin family protein
VDPFSHSSSIAPQVVWEGLLVRAVHGERMTLSLIELEPGAVVPEHSHENEQIGILVEGSLTFTIGGEVRELGPGATWTILANVPHSVLTGPGGAILVEAFSPPRSDWEAFEPLPARIPDLFA